MAAVSLSSAMDAAIVTRHELCVGVAVTLHQDFSTGTFQAYTSPAVVTDDVEVGVEDVHGILFSSADAGEVLLEDDRGCVLHFRGNRYGIG